MKVCSKSTLAGRVYNYHSSTLLAFLHIDVIIRHQIAGVKGAISRKRQVFEKIAQKSILTFHWLKIRHWNAVCACAFSYSRVDFNVRVYV